MDPALERLIVDRLAESELEGEAVELILAACGGADELEGAIGGSAVARPPASAQLAQEEEPPGVYLQSIGVQAFRGVGAGVSLELEAGPGLTIVAGRNGSGKSSFAEGLELLMTGANSRWTDRTKVWREGWQNLHADTPTVIKASLVIDGEPGVAELRREWERGSDLVAAACSVRRGDGSASSLDALGWTWALSRYRPFLSFNELGQMFDKLNTMYDALSAILGLDDVEELGLTLRAARLSREKAVKAARAQTAALAGRLEGVEDDRAEAVRLALAGRRPDLDAIELTLKGLGPETGGDLGVLRSLTALVTPDEPAVDVALGALVNAGKAVDALEGTNAGRAASLAALLEAAITHDDHAPGADCPVCGTAGALGEGWQASAVREIARLRDEAGAVQKAQADEVAARRRVGELLPASPPASVAAARELGLDPGPLEQAWDRWAAERDTLDDPSSIARLRETLRRLREAAAAFAAVARAELEAREDLWRPVAQQLMAWLPDARAAAAAAAVLPAVKAAEKWVAETTGELRAARLAPIEAAAISNWGLLRQESNVTLEGFHLRRAGNTRSAEVDVRVDGSSASAFGVMSQGELHALAVSVFLPRAALPESPFRFLVIDDPVQSMDPAKVDGLARVLSRAAVRRQVVVFTHDERLPEAVRRLGLPATVLEVTRRPRSVVEVRRALDPVQRYLEDARALVRSGAPPEVVARVVPGFCRHAIEAACTSVVRRRRLGRGDSHASVEAAVKGATTLSKHLALAFYDDEERSGEVMSRVNNKYGARFGDVVKLANRGAHEAVGVDLSDLVRDTGQFARALAGEG